MFFVEENNSYDDYLPRLGNSINSSGLSEPTPGSRGGSILND
jgi:hypothetical protein